MVRKCDESLAWYRDGMGDWLWSWGTPDSSAKFTQRGSRDEVGSSVPLCHWAHRMPTFEALTKGTFCTSRGKQCLHIRECPGRSLQFLSRMPLCFGTFFSTPNLGQHHPRYMCTTDPSQCSTETCHCEDPSHIRKALSCWCNLGQPVKSSSRANVSYLCVISACFDNSWLSFQEMQTVDRSTCYLLGPYHCGCPRPVNQKNCSQKAVIGRYDWGALLLYRNVQCNLVQNDMLHGVLMVQLVQTRQRGGAVQ